MSTIYLVWSSHVVSCVNMLCTKCIMHCIYFSEPDETFPRILLQRKTKAGNEVELPMAVKGNYLFEKLQVCMYTYTYMHDGI